jgi:hypothetical protein
MPRRAQASTRKQPITRYRAASTNGTPDGFMIVGEFVALRTVDSQKTAKPANRRLTGTINQSLLVSSVPGRVVPTRQFSRPSGGDLGTRRSACDVCSKEVGHPVSGGVFQQGSNSMHELASFATPRLVLRPCQGFQNFRMANQCERCNDHNRRMRERGVRCCLPTTYVGLVAH